MPRKALFLVNPAAGKRQSREPLFDAAAMRDADARLWNVTYDLGSGKLDGATCQTCAGTGVVIEEVGGA